LAQVRQPRLADTIVQRLRGAILSGRLQEGDSLPRQEDLISEFGVSLPIVREAMRILETEGLISVRRGNVGGAVVHLPAPERTALMISMVLQSRFTTPGDVSQALLYLEPVCAGLCARRADRDREVVPALRAALRIQLNEFDDPNRYTPNARRFHETLVECCGNQTMIVVLGALETIWSAHESSVWSQAPPQAYIEQDGSPVARTRRRAAVRDHEKLVDAIAAGNYGRASAVASTHLEKTRRSTLDSNQQTLIDANLVDRAISEGSGPPSRW
jgi:GntR family transcriptional repressor for pyruvate dehydrogenase complex